MVFVIIERAVGTILGQKAEYDNQCKSEDTFPQCKLRKTSLSCDSKSSKSMIRHFGKDFDYMIPWPLVEGACRILENKRAMQDITISPVNTFPLHAV